MNDRIVTLLGGLLALALVVIILVGPDPPSTEQASRPVSSDRGKYGLMGLVRWLEQAAVPVKPLRRRYDMLLSDSTLPPKGNLLVLSLPQIMSARAQERGALRNWLARGNRALVLVAASDSPEWSLPASEVNMPELRVSASNELLQDFGFQLKAEAEKKKEKRSGMQQEESSTNPFEFLARRETTVQHLTPHGDHPILEGVGQVEVRGESASPLSKLELIPSKSDCGCRVDGKTGPAPLRTTLVLLHDSAKAPAFWQVRMGGGFAWISRYADLFGDVSLGKSDNARLFANLLMASLGPGGSVVLDDMHMGVSELYDPEAFFKDARLHQTLWFLLGFWLLYLVGRASRLAPLSSPRTTPKSVDFVRAMGGLFARRVSPHVVARQLLANLFNELRARHRMPQNGEPAWDVLGRMPRVRPEQVEALRKVHLGLSARRTPDLLHLTNLIQDIRSILS